MTLFGGHLKIGALGSFGLVPPSRVLSAKSSLFAATSVSHDALVAAVIDETDAPAATLIKLLAPCVVFSGDKHLRNSGLALPDWRAVARAGLTVTEGDQVMSGAAAAVVLSPGLAIAGIDGIARNRVQTNLPLGNVALDPGRCRVSHG